MLRKTRALMLSVSLLGAGFAAFADSDQPENSFHKAKWRMDACR